jgi:hypothetical protein
LDARRDVQVRLACRAASAASAASAPAAAGDADLPGRIGGRGYGDVRGSSAAPAAPSAAAGNQGRARLLILNDGWRGSPSPAVEYEIDA